MSTDRQRRRPFRAGAILVTLIALLAIAVAPARGRLPPTPSSPSLPNRRRRRPRRRRPRPARSTVLAVWRSTPTGASTSPTTTTTRSTCYDGAADYLTPPVYGDRGYITQLSATDPARLAVEAPPATSTSTTTTAGGSPPRRLPARRRRRLHLRGTNPSGPSTGVAVDPATTTSTSTTAPTSPSTTRAARSCARSGPRASATATAIAVSDYSGTAGYLYVADAVTDTIKVYDPADSGNFPDHPARRLTVRREASPRCATRPSPSIASAATYYVTRRHPADQRRAAASAGRRLPPPVSTWATSNTTSSTAPRVGWQSTTPPAPATQAETKASLRHLRQHRMSAGDLHLSAWRGDQRRPTGADDSPTPLGDDILFPNLAIGAAAPPPAGSPATATPARCCRPTRSTRP